MSDSEGESELEELEDAEMKLYAQLYFDPNPDYEVVDTQLEPKGKEEDRNGSAVKELSTIEKGDGPNGVKSDDDMDSGISLTVLPSAIDINKERPESTEEPCKSTVEISTGSNDFQHKYGKRQRYSSACSIESISGNVPLDELYCVDLVSDEEIKEVERKLAVKEAIEEEITQEKFHRSTMSSKRKRDSDSYDSDDVEESKCDIIANIQSKIDIIEAYSSNDSDSDVQFVATSKEEIERLKLQLTQDENSELTEKKTEELLKKKSEASLLLEQVRKYSDLLDDDSESDSDIVCVESTTVKKFTTNVRTSNRNIESTNSVLQTKRFDYKKVLSETKHPPSCEKWTTAMATFYDSDILSEDLHVKDVHKLQSNSSYDWRIVAEDYPYIKRRRYFDERCSRCRQHGHSVDDCPRVPHCHLCASETHVKRYQCPDNCCFRCGEGPHAFCLKTASDVLCSHCGWDGHPQDLCPESWRRFHLTTAGSEAQAPSEDNRRPQNERYCYICSRRGHYGHTCKRMPNNIPYLPVPQTVVCYEAVERGNETVPMNPNSNDRQDQDSAGLSLLEIEPNVQGRIIGPRGVIIRELTKMTNTRIDIEKCMVYVTGSKEDRKAALEKLNVLLGNTQPDDHVDFINHIGDIKGDPEYLTYVKRMFRKKNRQMKMAAEGYEDSQKKTKSAKQRNKKMKASKKLSNYNNKYGGDGKKFNKGKHSKKVLNGDENLIHNLEFNKGMNSKNLLFGDENTKKFSKEILMSMINEGEKPKKKRKSKFMNKRERRKERAKAKLAKMSEITAKPNEPSQARNTQNSSEGKVKPKKKNDRKRDKKKKSSWKE